MTFLSLLAFTLALSSTAFSADLSLNAYLEQVRQTNESFQASQAQARGSKALTKEADLIYAPKLFGELRTGFDEKLPSPPTLVYDGASTNYYSVGVNQQTSIGLSAKFSYDITDTTINGAGSALGSNNRFTDGIGKLELSMPLWANGFGRGVRANEEVTRQQATANSFNALSQSANLLAGAESAYWRLVAATEQLQIEQQTLQGAQNIQSYVTQKKRKDLGETADVLQANALVEASNLRVQQAQAEMDAAKRDFNLYLNREANESVSGLEGLDFGSLEKVALPTNRTGDRPEIKAGEAQANLAKASGVLAAERNKPNLDLYGGYAVYGQDSSLSRAFEKSGQFQRDGAYVGVRFSVPLNLSGLAEARAGANLSIEAAEKNLSYLRYSQEQQWTNFVQRLADAKRSLALAGAMEKAQRAKLENERARLRQGRTTTYQVLLFEQDYNGAQAARVQAASQILNLQSQLKIYQASLQ